VSISGTTVEDKGFNHISSIVLALHRLLNPDTGRKTPVGQQIPMYNLRAAGHGKGRGELLFGGDPKSI